MKVPKTFRINPDILKKLNTFCASQDRTFTWVIEKALLSYIGESGASQESVKGVVVSKKEIVKPIKPKFSDDHMRFSVWAFECIQNTMSGAKKPNLESWAKDVRLMMEVDNRSIDDMANIWQWARNDSFWQSNILSIKKFREKFDTLKAQSMRPKSSGGNQYKTAQEKAAERAAQTRKMDSAEDLEF